MITIAFTGHRPNKLGGYDWNNPKNQRIMLQMSKEIKDILDKNIDNQVRFITGGALGIDQMAFDICNKLKNKYNGIITEIAIPFKNQASKWYDTNDIQRYNKQLKQADIITYVDIITKYKIPRIKEGIYNPIKMQKRNEYMVDNCDLLIAVYDGISKGGTRNCINYANKLNKKIIYINPNKC